MTDTEIRIAIAEVCGWTDIKVWRAGHLSERVTGVQPKVGLPGSGSSSHFDVPEYLTDLNAMHEAEKVIDSAGLRGRYIEELEVTCTADGRKWPLIHATARQRAIAFLKAKGKYHES